MNITNADYFTFNAHNSVLLVGQTGSGKSYLAHNLIERFERALKPEMFKYTLFDLKQVEFNTIDGSANSDYLYFDIVKEPYTGLDKLEELVEECNRRMSNPGPWPLLLIYIEECDMAAIDQSRFDTAVIHLNAHASVVNMKIIYSTSRLSSGTVSKKLIESFDLLLVGQLASDANYAYLGVQKPKQQKAYSFAVVEH